MEKELTKLELDLKSLIKEFEKQQRTRELSLVITKLEEAELWLNKKIYKNEYHTIFRLGKGGGARQPL